MSKSCKISPTPEILLLQQKLNDAQDHSRAISLVGVVSHTRGPRFEPGIRQWFFEILCKLILVVTFTSRVNTL